MPLTKDEVLDIIDKYESFKGVEIGDVNFTNHTFSKHVDFRGAIFIGKANFSSAIFKNKLLFLPQFLKMKSLSKWLNFVKKLIFL